MIDHRRWAHIHLSRSISLLGGIICAIFVACLIVILSPFLVFALMVAITFLLIVLRWPWVGFLALVATVPAQQFLALQRSGELITLTQIVFPLALAGYVIALVVHREPIRLHASFVPFILLLCIMFISALDAESSASSLAEIARWTVAFLSLVIAVHFFSADPHRRLLAAVIVFALGGVFEATTGIVQSALALGPESFQVTAGLTRAFGTFGKPNTYAAYLVMVLFPVFLLALYYIRCLPASWRRYASARSEGMAAGTPERLSLFGVVFLSAFFSASSMIIFSGVIASLSRGAWLGFVVGAICVAILWNSISRFLALLAAPIIGLLLLGGLAGIIPSGFSNRLSADTTQFRLFDASGIPITDENFAAVERMAHWQAGWRMFEDNPISGVGVGNFNERYPDYYVREEFRFSRGHAHNYYIHSLAETGIAGLIAYISIALGMIFLAIRTIIGMQSGYFRYVSLGALGAMVAVAVHDLFENLHVLNLGIQLSVLWSIIIVTNLQWRRDDIRLSKERA